MALESWTMPAPVRDNEAASAAAIEGSSALFFPPARDKFVFARPLDALAQPDELSDVNRLPTLPPRQTDRTL